MLPPTTERVRAHTAERVNEQIQRQTEANIAYYGARPDRISGRLSDLDEEWDIERALEANAAAIGLLGLLGATRDRRWLVLPIAVSGFLLQHALQGWCPPLPILRRLGFRTASEIDEERVALRRRRGDFVGASSDAQSPSITSSG
jgi:hypothetical protein